MTVPPRVSAPVSEPEVERRSSAPLTDEIMALVERHAKSLLDGHIAVTASCDIQLRSRLVSLEQELTILRRAHESQSAPERLLDEETFWNRVASSSPPSDADECPCVGCQTDPSTSSKPRTTEKL